MCHSAALFAWAQSPADAKRLGTLGGRCWLDPQKTQCGRPDIAITQSQTRGNSNKSKIRPLPTATPCLLASALPRHLGCVGSICPSKCESRPRRWRIEDRWSRPLILDEISHLASL
jgi:hypothetical protein